MKFVLLIIGYFLPVICGLQDGKLEYFDGKFPEISPRIIGGEMAEKSQFPYQTGVLSYFGDENNSKTIWCGGSLISSRYVLTAAHCVHKAFKAVVFLGINNILNQTEEGRKLIGVFKSSLIVHPNYNTTSSRNDVALIRLTEDVEMDDHIQTIDLPPLNQKPEDIEGIIGVATGWGSIKDGGGAVMDLRFVPLRIISGEFCKFYYFKNYETDKQICISGAEHHSVCHGDSGGPLVIKNPRSLEEMIVVGVASFVRITGCERNHPFVYVRVQAYLPWIHDVTGIPISKKERVKNN